MSPLLGSVIRQNRTQILQRWQVRVAGLTQELEISRIELLDHMPDFVDGLIVMLDTTSATTATIEAPAQTTAPLHGAQRLRVGFDVDEVIREYGILADVMLATLAEADATIGIDDHRRLLTAVNTGAAEAVREYVRRRDEELHREQARHRAFVAHELRTPLATAVAAATLLAQRHPEVQTGRPLALLDRSLAKVRELIDQVLIAGRLEAGVEPQRTTVDVAAMLAELTDTLAPEAENRRVDLAVSAPASLTAEVDARLISSAMANLLRNAIKYTRADTTVRIVLTERDGMVVLEVTDQCGGIAATNWATLFEPYARGDDVVTRQRDGLGLGLAIAKEAAEAHGGSLAVRNVAPDGCVFELRVPRSAPPAA